MYIAALSSIPQCTELQNYVGFLRVLYVINYVITSLFAPFIMEGKPKNYYFLFLTKLSNDDKLFLNFVLFYKMPCPQKLFHKTHARMET